MFPLSGKTFPTSNQELIQAMQGALAQLLELPAGRSPVVIRGGAFPAIAEVTIDLSGARLRDAVAPARAASQGKPGITVGRLEVIARPIYYQQSRADFSMTAGELALDFARSAEGDAMLVLRDAGQGEVRASIAKADLQAALLSAASEAAKQQGVTIQDLQLDLHTAGPRSLSVEARVKAKKMFMSGTIVVRGKADVDDNLVATLSDLSCRGEGVVGTMAASFIQDHLKKVQGRTFPLMAFSLGEVTLRNLEISAGDQIAIAASFGR
jgi:hypothetical protein